LHNTADYEEHNGDEGKREHTGYPLCRAAVEGLQTVQENDTNLLATVLAALVLKVVLHSFFLLLISQMKIFLREFFDMLFFLLDVRLSNFDECVFKTV